jgi:hypothetical protein
MLVATGGLCTTALGALGLVTQPGRRMTMGSMLVIGAATLYVMLCLLARRVALLLAHRFIETEPP